MHQLSQYLYVVDLLAGKRVLELGCGRGDAAFFLANHGAAHVIGVDRSQRLIEAARRRHRLSNLEFRCELSTRIELDDASVDCVLVGDGANFVRRADVIEEVRRILAGDGHLIVGAPSADRRAARGGVAYYEFFERLEPTFAPVRMVAQRPFVATSLVVYAEDEAGPLAVELDTSLVDGDVGDDVTHYLAICGGPAGERLARGLAVIQLPTAGEIDAGRDQHSEELELERADNAERDQRLADAELRVAALAAELATWRERAATAEEELEARPAADSARGDLEEELERCRKELERVTDNWRQTEAKNDEVWRRVGELQSDLERQREDAVTNASRQRKAGQVAVTRAVDEASKRLVSVQDQLLRAERSSDDRAARLATLEERNAELERHLEDAEQTRTQLEDEVAAVDGRREEVERLLAELEADMGDAPLPVPVGSGASPEALALAELERSMSADELDVANAAAALVALRAQVGGIAAEVATLRGVVAEIGTGLVDLAELPRNLSGRPREGRMRDLSTELGIKDAELTLLNLGVSSLQQRVVGIVDQVRDTRQAMSGRSAAEMKDLVDRLAESLAGLV